MKKIVFLVLFFSLFASDLLVTGISAQEDKMNDTMKTIFSRKSVRNFTGQAVSREDLVLIAKAGMAAPIAVNMQPWAFLIIRDRNTLDALMEILPCAKMLNKAGAAIIVCALPA
ncbi:MAG TPA: nitroreductase family protein, partial [Candidatus Omnitrophota bacterium]|nr:nitroreductase family protein [Candidatus Omnitrophota bacterium]